MRRGGVVLVEEYYKHGGSRRATDEVLAQHGEGRRANPAAAAAAAAAAVSTYAVGEQTRPRFGFSQQGRPTEALSFAQVGRLQALKHGEVRRPGSGRAGRPRLGAASRLRTVAFLGSRAEPVSLSGVGPAAQRSPRAHAGRRPKRWFRCVWPP